MFFAPLHKSDDCFQILDFFVHPEYFYRRQVYEYRDRPGNPCQNWCHSIYIDGREHSPSFRYSDDNSTYSIADKPQRLFSRQEETTIKIII